MFLSIMGMYEYDPHMFDELNVPAGINKLDVINEICLQCGELEVVYPEIGTMKLAIAVWSVANNHTWTKLYNTMNLNYNPIWNVDATESETYGRGYTDEISFGSNNTESVQGFNSSSWSDNKKYANGGKDTRTGREDSGSTKTRSGNIGVTTTQKMIQEERDIAAFNIINYIAMSFKERFCLLVY